MQVCISLQTDNHASTPPLSFLQAGCPSCHPTNSVKALKANWLTQCTTNMLYNAGLTYLLAFLYLHCVSSLLFCSISICYDMYSKTSQAHLEMNPPLSHFRRPSVPCSKRYSGWCKMSTSTESSDCTSGFSWSSSNTTMSYMYIPKHSIENNSKL